ncbi:MAG TPA: SDR family oxidoreductase [Longimicrobiales bacterium]|nr:SDR family oxidoreductase [Longimicrobiales bacterium]
MLSLDFSGKKAVVTGGSRGVGRAVALMLKQAGARVGISYHNRAKDAEAVGVEWIYGCDLSKAEQADRLFDKAQKEFGNIDIFVGNAGIWNPSSVPISEMTDAQWRETIGINLDSIFYTTRAAARMINDHGRIVLIGSTAGQRGEAFHADYAASKGAMISLVKGLCIELASRDVTVNCVAPGWIDTEMAALPYAEGGKQKIEAGIPLGRVATAEDIAGPVIFLCSQYARHITGEIMNVNGGSVLCG